MKKDFVINHFDPFGFAAVWGIVSAAFGVVNAIIEVVAAAGSSASVGAAIVLAPFGAGVMGWVFGLIGAIVANFVLEHAPLKISIEESVLEPMVEGHDAVERESKICGSCGLAVDDDVQQCPACKASW